MFAMKTVARGSVKGAVIVVALCLCLTPDLARAGVSATPSRTFVPNGSVSAILPTASAIYIGGDFTSVGPRTGPGVGIDASTARSTGLPQVAGGQQLVLAVAPDASGGFYIGGDFTRVGGSARLNLAHVLANGKVDPSFHPDPNGSVHALAASGGTVYAGGDFTTMGGRPRNRIAALNATTGNAKGWNPDAGNSVLALAVSGQTVYAGGKFRSIGGQSRNLLAALDTSTGKATAWNPNGPSRAFVSALAVAGHTIYVGGRFDAFGGQSRLNIAALDTSTGRATSWDPGASPQYSYVDALAVSGRTVYAGGSFASIGGRPRTGVAALSAGTGKATAWDAKFSGSAVHSLAVSGGTIYVGGLLGPIGGKPRSGIAALDTTTAKATSWNPNVQGPLNGYNSSEVDAIAISGSTVYAGGRFTSIGGRPRQGIAALDPITGRLTGWNPGAGKVDSVGSVDALAASGKTVYASGDFNSIGGRPRNGIAALDATTGKATSWNPGVTGGGITVRGLAASGRRVYVWGGFTSIGGQTRHGIAAINSSNGKATAWNPNAMAGAHAGAVYSLAVSGQTVYAGGRFSAIGGRQRRGIAAIDATTGRATSWNPNASGNVSDLVVSGNTVYVGGNFTSIGSQPRNGIAALDAATGKATSWNPQTEPFSHVDALAIAGQTVYAGGHFDSIGGQARHGIAALDATTGAATPWNPNPIGGGVQALAFGPDGSLWAGGPFAGFPTVAQSGIARFAP
jgi:hypothetical protein